MISSVSYRIAIGIFHPTLSTIKSSKESCKVKGILSKTLSWRKLNLLTIIMTLFLVPILATRTPSNQPKYNFCRSDIKSHNLKESYFPAPLFSVLIPTTKLFSEFSSNPNTIKLNSTKYRKNSIWWHHSKEKI